MKDSEIIVKYKKEGYNFEIIVYLRKALEFKEGKIKDIREVLVTEDIFKDAKKGERVSTESLKKVFGTTDVLKVAEEIIKNSEIPLPTEYKRELIEERKKQIIEYIRRIAYDAKNNMPLTYERAKELFEMIRYNVDLNKPIEKQAEEVIKEIRKKYPLKIEYKTIRLTIYPQKFKIIGIIKNKYKIIKIDDVYYDFRNNDSFFDWLNDLKENSLLKFKAFTGSEYYFEEPLFDEFEYRREITIKVRLKNRGDVIYIGTLWRKLNVLRKLDNEEKRFYKFLLDTGLGILNSMGFGFVNIK